MPLSSSLHRRQSGLDDSDSAQDPDENIDQGQYASGNSSDGDFVDSFIEAIADFDYEQDLPSGFTEDDTPTYYANLDTFFPPPDFSDSESTLESRGKCFRLHWNPFSLLKDCVVIPVNLDYSLALVERALIIGLVQVSKAVLPASIYDTLKKIGNLGRGQNQS
jgi:hypothetical protein